MALYDDLGGAPAVAAALDAFYVKVLHDPQLSPYFDGVDMTQLKTKVGAFFAMALGGPSEYHGGDLRASHARLRTMGLDDSTTDVFLGYFRDVLTEFGVAAATIDAVLAVAESARPEILAT